MVNQHKKGKVADGKEQVNWRVLVGPLKILREDAAAAGFSNVVGLVNHLFVRYCNGENIQRGQ